MTSLPGAGWSSPVLFTPDGTADAVTVWAGRSARENASQRGLCHLSACRSPRVRVPPLLTDASAPAHPQWATSADTPSVALPRFMNRVFQLH